MQLSLHADYSLRVLIYAGTHAKRQVTTSEISQAYGISKNHLVRVVQTLASHKYLRVQTGRTGGITLARDPGEIRLGQVIRDTEPSLRLLECFDPATNTCPIVPACRLKNVMMEGLNAFLAVLDEHTLADLLQPPARERLAQLFLIGPPANSGTAQLGA